MNMKTKKSEKSFLYKLIFNNINYKILALTVTLLWWFSTIKDRVLVETIKVPIKYVNISKNLVIADYKPKKLKFDVKVKGEKFYNIKQKNIYYQVDLNNYTKGKYQLRITKDKLQNVSNLNIFNLKKDFKIINIVIDKKVNKKVPINPKIIGSLPNNYKLKKPIKLEPEKVEIMGPKSVDRIQTYPIDIAELNSSVKKEIRLKLPSNTNIKNKKENYFAYIEISKLKNIKLRQIPISITGDYSLIYPKVLEMEFRVPVSMNENKIKNNINVSINIDEYDPGTYNIIPKIEYPDKIELIDYSPKEVQVIIK